MNEKKMQEMKTGGLSGAIAGIILFAAFYAISSNVYTLLFIPVAIVMGMAQAHLSPRNR